MASTIQVDKITDIGGNTMLESNGSGTITGLPASAVSSGTIATARLGSGTASSSTFLRGDQTYAEAGGGLVALGQVDSGGNVGEINLDNKFSATYKNYLILVDKMTPATDGSNIVFRLRDDTPSSISSDYSYVSRAYRANDNGLNSSNGDGASSIILSDNGVSNNSSRLGLKMAMWIQNPFASTVKTSGHGTFQYVNTGAVSVGGYMQFLHKNSASPRGIQFFANSGDINGRIKIYGVIDS